MMSCVVDPCLTHPCRNGGTCVTEDKDNRNCTCLKQFVGTDCQFREYISTFANTDDCTFALYNSEQDTIQYDTIRYIYVRSTADDIASLV